MTWQEVANSGWLWGAAIIGMVLGAAMAFLISDAVMLRLAKERDDWRTKTGYLVCALRPFAPMQMKAGDYPKPYWVCPTCAPGGLIGSCPPDWTLAEVADEARRHFVDEHLTKANVQRAGETLAVVLGERWWRP